jgi:F-type H+-transporting ATPase subunit b
VSLKSDVGVLATALAGKILGSQLQDADVQSSMIDSMLDDIDNGNGSND